MGSRTIRVNQDLLEDLRLLKEATDAPSYQSIVRKLVDKELAAAQQYVKEPSLETEVKAPNYCITRLVAKSAVVWSLVGFLGVVVVSGLVSV